MRPIPLSRTTFSTSGKCSCHPVVPTTRFLPAFATVLMSFRTISGEVKSMITSAFLSPAVSIPPAGSVRPMTETSCTPATRTSRSISVPIFPCPSNPMCIWSFVQKRVVYHVSRPHDIRCGYHQTDIDIRCSHRNHPQGYSVLAEPCGYVSHYILRGCDSLADERYHAEAVFMHSDF